MNNRKKIAVFFGGCSAEYAVSLQSASAVIRSMDKEKYEPILIGINIFTIKYNPWYTVLRFISCHLKTLLNHILRLCFYNFNNEFFLYIFRKAVV